MGPAFLDLAFAIACFGTWAPRFLIWHAQLWLGTGEPDVAISILVRLPENEWGLALPDQAPKVGVWSDMYGRKPFLMLAYAFAGGPMFVLLGNLTIGLSLFFYFPAAVRVPA